ncbi:MAG: AsmA-like C-terminal domain-containing protein [Deltaproteobacteria bacterium]|nr:AsmA-like C-terminal domain-containing protein [Deltaproteobacteria bacterium]
MRKRRRHYFKLSGLLFLFLGTTLIGLALFLPNLLDINAYRDDIIATLQQSLNRKVSFGHGEFSMRFGPAFVFDDVTVKEPDGNSDFLTAKRITVELALLPLLEKRAVLREFSLEGADVRLVRGSDGRLNIDDLLKPRPEAIQMRLKKVRVKKGVLHWRDMAIRKEGLTVDARNLNLSLDNLSRGHKGSIGLSCELPAASGAAATVSLSGTAKLPAGAKSLMETELNASADIKQAEVGRFWPYYGRFIPFGNPGGRLDIVTSFKGKPREFSAKGKVRLNNAAVTWPAVFHAVVAPSALQLDYSMKLTSRLLDIPSLELSTDGFRIKGSLQLHDYAGKDPRIVAKASTPTTFRYEDVRGYIPFGIIEKDTADYIEHRIKSGVFKLDTGILDGRVSQIAHMERDENYNTLLIRGPVEKAVLSYGPKAPAFTNIKGTLELKGKNFNLIGMTGTFGSSPFKMHGSITEYNTDKPSDYPAHMEITTHGPEVAWLARIAGADKLEFSGNSSLVLNGGGHYSAYRLNGEWELKQALYAFPGAIRKPSGMANNLTFSSVIGAGETRLTSLAYSLPPLNLSATAILKYGDQPYLGFDLQTNPFAWGDTLPILTMWQQYHPRGKAQAHVTGRGNPEDFAAMDYSGTIELSSFAFQPGGGLKPLSNINSSIIFKGNSLETSGISMRYGDSLINAKGRIRNFKNPEAEITLSSPQFFLRDAKLAQPGTDASIRRMNASFTIQDNRYTIRNISGLFNTSNFSISGNYTGGRTPEANLSVTSSNLDVDDLVLLSKLGTPQGSSEQAGSERTRPKLGLKLRLGVDAGNYRKLQFTKLSATFSRDDGVLYLQGLDTTLFGGRVSAKGRLAPAGSEGKRYDLAFNLERINAERFFQALDITREVTGRLNLQGDLSASGATMADIRKSAQGNVRIRMEDGSLRRFNVLSKVFSILNVSQLLKFQLPDMVSGGMPYNEIKGSIAIKDGIASSQDLFIKSDAINMSIIGRADIVREELDLTIGVQPLQTVDKIVNRIPVVGWLLTGKDRSVLSAYFEAKGKWSDPKVSAIPVKSMTKGVLNVFRRAFELPVRLFTDTGEVILGN